MGYWDDSWDSTWRSPVPVVQPKCRSCNKDCKVAYVFVPSTDVSVKATCANCMKSKDSVKDKRLFLLAKYERHLDKLTDAEIDTIIKTVKDK